MRSLVCAVLVVASLTIGNSAPAAAVTLDDVSELIASAPIVDGTATTVGKLEGRVVVVTFFASWCPPCRSEFDHLNNLRERVGKDQLTIVAINLFENWGGKDNAARMARFLADTRPAFALVEGSEALRLAFGDIERIPSVVVLGADGREVWRFVHQRGAAKTHATADDLMAALAAAGLNVPGQ